ncbi:MAG: hypothetical protein LBT68_05160 [Spirochaetales bacterium]|jgi:hypothetical protein|nr:hypothetical protein [Spirochaetales bacterium]
MPLVEDIQPFIATLSSLGHEPEITARSGETLEPFVIPPEGLPEDLENLLQSSSPPAHSGEDSGEEEPETPAEDPLDFSSVADEPEEDSAEDDGGGEGDEDLPQDALDASLDDFTFPDSILPEGEDADMPADDFAAGLPDLDADMPAGDSKDDTFDLPDSFDDFTISDEEEPPEKSAADEKAEPAAKSADDILEDFSFPDMQTPDLGAEKAEEPPEMDLDSLADFMTDDPESRADDSGPPSEGEEASSGEDDLNLDDFTLPDFAEDISGETGEEAPVGNGIEEFEEVPEEEAPAKDDTDFALPDDLSLDEGIELPGEEGPDEGGEPEAAAETEAEQEAAAEPGPHDEFSLGDFGADFGVQEAITTPSTPTAEINIPSGASGVIDEAAAGAAFSLSEEDFSRMQETLQSLPLNIKIVVEELIGDQKADETAQMNLIRMLVKGASIRNIAAAAGKLAGRTLVIPRGYAKGSGTAWEAEKGSFAYFLRETFLPVFKIASLIVISASLLIFLGYKFIYKPIHAHILLSRGYEMIQDDRFRDGNTLFTEGYREWPFKDWYFRYAETFIEKRQYQLAREKYEQLISEYNDYLDAKGIRRERTKDEYFVKASVDYAHFESVLLENFEGAEKILKRLLTADMYNYAGLLESGDNYIRWAEYDEKRFYDKYEEARKAYAVAMEAYGGQDEILFRFLDVFMHTGNKPEVLRIKNYFEANPKKVVDPRRYAELGGYLLDENESVGEVRQILFRALEADKTVPDIHYHLARFYKKREEARDERLALNNAIHLYGAARPVSRKGMWRLVDAYGRSGELYLREKSFLEAEGEFKQGIERYEDGIKKTLLKKDANLGRLYSELGDIYYYQSGDLEAAYQQFAKAEDSLVTDPVLYYKKGFIRYTQEDYFDALREFTRTEESFPSSRNLLFALGNANYMRSNFSIAEGYYSFLTERLEADRRRAGQLIPDDRASDRALVFNLIKTYNNLGVILYRMGERTGNVRNTSRAMVLWTNSSELSENLARERETMVRRDTKNLAYLNLRQILNPLPNYELQIYQPLPRDMNELAF